MWVRFPRVRVAHVVLVVMTRVVVFLGSVRGDVHQRASRDPLCEGLNGLRQVAAVQWLVEIVDDGGEDLLSLVGIEHRLRGG
jgi:hypothetical protein